MKTSISFLLPVLLFIFISCSSDQDPTNIVEDPVSEVNASISNIALLTSSTATNPQEITVTIDKPTPCHKIVETKKTFSGKIYNYDFVVKFPSGDVMCAQVETPETAVVIFDPATSGDYTINFLINGRLVETRSITVTE